MFVIFLVVTTSLWVFLDAKKIGVKKGQRKGLFDLSPNGWLIACLLLWVVSYFAYMFRARKEYLTINGKEVGLHKGILIGCICFSFLVGFMLQGDSAEVSMVKNGKLDAYPNVTIGEMVKSYMGSPSWESGVSDQGVAFVNISGDITVQGKKVRAMIQFIVNKNAQKFDYQAITLNGEKTIDLVAMALLEKMAESVKK